MREEGVGRVPRPTLRALEGARAEGAWSTERGGGSTERGTVSSSPLASFASKGPGAEPGSGVGYGMLPTFLLPLYCYDHWPWV